MAGAAQLYTTDILALAVELADYPLSGQWDARADVRAPVCGSALKLGLRLDQAHAIERIGMQVQACAIGQAAAAIFARHAAGKDLRAIEDVKDALALWLGNRGARPDWPDLDRLDTARPYPARHGAIILPWKAAREALSPQREAS